MEVRFEIEGRLLRDFDLQDIKKELQADTDPHTSI